MELRRFAVPAEKLRWQCDAGQFQFECTKDLPVLDEFVGQDRAIRAIEFGLNMHNAGYNIFVAGLSGTGKTSIVKEYIERLIAKQASVQPAPSLEDWCYLHNFKEPDRPRIVNLPQGMGKRFRDRIVGVLSQLRENLGRAFSSEDYQARKKKLFEEGHDRQQQLFKDAAEEVRRQGFSLQITPMGPVVIALANDRPMQESEYLALQESERKKLDAKQAELMKLVQANFEKAGAVQRETAERLQDLDKNIAEFAVSTLFAPLLDEYKSPEKLPQYLEDLKAYTLGNLELFKSADEPVNPLLGVPMSQALGGRNPFLPFQINVFVDNRDRKGPPVATEPNPHFGNIFGKIERRFLLGGYLSDHTMLKPGALSLANGGFLLLNARDVLMNPGVWITLKRAIRNKEVRVEDPFEQFGLFAPQGMRAEPMPIDVKVVLIGDADLYQLLSAYDEDFWEIFKVKADFNFEIDRTEKSMMDYAAVIRCFCEDCNTRHLEPGGVAKVIEYAARAVGDQQKLSARFAQLKEWIQEADYWASQDGADRIAAKHVTKAIEEKMFRHNLIDERLREMIAKDLIMIDVEGERIGQINGLSVYSVGDAMFGRPSRITASTFLGRSGVVNIEREVELSGPTHSKGVMILSGYLGAKYAQEEPLSLSAALCFEQSYQEIDGDSASSAELYAILSSLSGIPIRQSIAVTGSVNQWGEIQPIGGVNQKIEGFFQVCRAKGLTGEQGVLIPQRNVGNLMLREEVVEAVREGRFHIYAARTIDDGIEILMGAAAGERQPDGTYPEGAVHERVSRRLKVMAEKLLRQPPKEE
ncbi:MAG: AAA family ATPase [Syntrophales bacterium]|jgi:predicted ATP-dependent protease|nr:AAA family ATPase [Syntrophales bacterium]